MRETSNYKLSQWDKTDRIEMEDFNSDNEKTDAALQGLVQHIASERAEVDAALQGLAGRLTAERAEVDAALATKGNCRIERYTYAGTGTYGKNSPNSMTFSGKPLLMVLLTVSKHMVFHSASEGTMTNPQGFPIYVSWSGNTFSWYSDTAEHQLNEKGATYTMIALHSA